MKIGELSSKSGVPIKTIRYYEEFGLLKSESRTEGNFRLFTEDSINRLHFIKRLQLLGLSLEEIRQCLSIVDQGELPCADIQDKLQNQIKKIDQQVTELLLLKEELTILVEKWSISNSSQPHTICPILQI
jgi:DNA-binding transcriptional MerR regulator